jgi:hypothetical protein
MQPKKIFESDLQLIQSCFFESIPAGVVFDPEEKVAKNVDGDLIFITTEDELALVAKTASDVLLFVIGEDEPNTNLSEFGGVITTTAFKIDNLQQNTIHYFEGNFNTIRFAFTSTLKKPLFYRIKGDKYEYPKYKQIADELFMKMGLNWAVAAPKFFTYSKTDTNDLVGKPCFVYGEQYVFTKQATVFETDNEEIVQVRKIGDSDYAREHNEKEARIIEGLKPLIAGDKLVIPELKSFEGHLVLSNNFPAGAEMTDQLEDLHLEALNEIYEANKTVKKVGEFLVENNYLQMIKAFKLILEEDLHPNGLSKSHLEDISIDLITLINRLDPREPVFTSIFHGAFEPANCLKKDGKIYLNNFDSFEQDMPMLFDAFHYIFYQLEKEPMPLMGELDDIMKYLFKNKALLKLIEEHSINFKLNLALFHIHHIIHKVESFLKQRFINPNANFTLTFYKQALERMNSIKVQ